MDLDLLRTFLEVKRLKHFGRAAESLYLTQAAVSARIRKLEETLGVTLFNRLGREVTLTPEGARLIRHAEQLLADWRKAQQEVAFSEHHQQQLSIAGVNSLWDFLLQDWLHNLAHHQPHLAIIADALSEEGIQRRIANNIVDLGFVYEPPMLSEMSVEEVATTNLILFSTRKGQSACQAMEKGYVMVDWGHGFDLQHGRLYPDIPPPQYRMGRSSMAKEFILNSGGAAYLHEYSVLSEVKEGLLHPVVDAVAINRSIYAIYLARSSKYDFIQKSLQLFQKYEDNPYVDKIVSQVRETI